MITMVTKSELLKSISDAELLTRMKGEGHSEVTEAYQKVERLAKAWSGQQEELAKAWTEEARKAAAEARKGQQHHLQKAAEQDEKAKTASDRVKKFRNSSMSWEASDKMEHEQAAKDHREVADRYGELASAHEDGDNNRIMIAKSKIAAGEKISIGRSIGGTKNRYPGWKDVTQPAKADAGKEFYVDSSEKNRGGDPHSSHGFPSYEKAANYRDSQALWGAKVGIRNKN